MTIIEMTYGHKAECDCCRKTIATAVKWKDCNNLAKFNGAKWEIKYPKWESNLYCEECWDEIKKENK